MTPQVNKENKEKKEYLGYIFVFYFLIKLKSIEFYFQGILLMSEAICRRNLNMEIANVSYNI